MVLNLTGKISYYNARMLYGNPKLDCSSRESSIIKKTYTQFPYKHTHTPAMHAAHPPTHTLYCTDSTA